MFVGVAVQPAFAEVSIKPDNSELVEITVQFYEVDRTYNHTVMLTKEQAEELEKLINNFEIKLDNSDNKVETEAIFKDTVVSLNELGILPKDMSIDKAQRLVTGKEHNLRIVKFLERWINKNPKSLGSDENALCLIAGHTSYTGFLGPLGRITYGILGLILIFTYVLEYVLDFYLYDVFLSILFVYIILGSLIWRINPLPFGYEIGLGVINIFDPHERFYPAKGWVYTKGSNGEKQWSGSLKGDLPLTNFNFDIYNCYSGVLGFTGIKISYQGKPLYLGSALWVKIKNV